MLDEEIRQVIREIKRWLVSISSGFLIIASFFSEPKLV